jgi:hypothetical protein
MPLLGLLQALDPLFVVKALLLGNSLEHVLDSRHHTLETAEVDVRSVLKLVENLIGVFLNLVLNVHLSTRLVGLFTGKSVVDTEVRGELLLGLLEFVIIEESVNVGNTQEKPCLSFVRTSSGGVFGKQTADESTVGSNTGTSGNHDVIGCGILLGHEHDLSSRSGHRNLITRRGVTEEVGADTLLGRIVSLEFRAPVSGTTDAQGSGLTSHIITISRGGDGVKSDGVGLAILFTDTWRDHSPTLALPVREVTIVVDDDVASLTGGLGADNTLSRDNLSSERGFVLVNIDRNSGLIKVRLSLKEILGLDSGAKEFKKDT